MHEGFRRVRLAAISIAYWLAVAIVAFVIFFATNLAGSAGVPGDYLSTVKVLAVAFVLYLIGIFILRRRERL